MDQCMVGVIDRPCEFAADQVMREIGSQPQVRKTIQEMQGEEQIRRGLGYAVLLRVRPLRADFEFQALSVHWEPPAPAGSRVVVQVRISGDGKTWTAWRDVTPKHNALVEAMIGCRAHFIATMRVKMEHVQEVGPGGKVEIRKVGLQSIQREGMEYEFTLVGDMDHTHTLKISKTRIDGIDIGDMFERPGDSFARRLYGWLMSGAPPAQLPGEVASMFSAIGSAPSLDALTDLIEQIKQLPSAYLDEARRLYAARQSALS